MDFMENSCRFQNFLHQNRCIFQVPFFMNFQEYPSEQIPFHVVSKGEDLLSLSLGPGSTVDPRPLAQLLQTCNWLSSGCSLAASCPGLTLARQPVQKATLARVYSE